MLYYQSDMNKLTRKVILVVGLGILSVSTVFASPPTLQDFLLAPSLMDVALSPNGKYLAKITNKDSFHVISVNDISHPDWPAMAMLSDNIIRANKVVWANNARLLINMHVPKGSKKLREKSEKDKDFDIDDYYTQDRVMAMDIDGKNVITLMGNKSFGVNMSLSNIQHYLPDDPKHVLIDAYRNGRRALYKVNIDDGDPEFVVKGSKYTYRFIMDEKGLPKFRIDYRSWSKKILIYKYLGKDDWEKLDTIYLNKDDQESINVDGLVGLFNEELVYRKRNEETGFYQLQGFSRNDKKSRVIVSLPEQDVRGVVQSALTQKILGYSIETDNVRFKFFKSETQRFYDEVATYLDGNNFNISNYSQSTNSSIVNFWGPDNPGAYSLYNNNTKKMTLLGYSYPERSTEKLALPAISTYKARDGQDIRNYILLPENYEKGTRLPMIVLPHGGPQSRSRLTYNDFAQFVSTRGYIVIQPNFRGSTGYGQEFEEAGYKQWGQLMQDDVTDAAQFMIDKGFADANKICIVGFSYGGYAALMGSIKTPDLYQCAISINGVTHLPNQIEFDISEADDAEEFIDGYIDKYILRRMGDPEIDMAMLKQNSPALHADKITIPLLIIAGEKDKVVPFEQAETLVGALEDHNKIFEFIEIDDAGHQVLNNKENIELVYKKVEAFLAKHLLH